VRRVPDADGQTVCPDVPRLRAIRRARPGSQAVPITAVLALYPRDDHLYVENIAVDPSAQGFLLNDFHEGTAEPARRKLDRLALVTRELMTRNQAIYARLGYIEIERRSEDGYRRICMQKPLND
jgi:ribosomal protein S18 acetylase RimI-like enzyme